jgi:hypothetical protein
MARLKPCRRYKLRSSFAVPLLQTAFEFLGGEALAIG